VTVLKLQIESLSFKLRVVRELSPSSPKALCNCFGSRGIIACDIVLSFNQIRQCGAGPAELQELTPAQLFVFLNVIALSYHHGHKVALDQINEQQQQLAEQHAREQLKAAFETLGNEKGAEVALALYDEGKQAQAQSQGSA